MRPVATRSGADARALAVFLVVVVLWSHYGRVSAQDDAPPSDPPTEIPDSPGEPREDASDGGSVEPELEPSDESDETPSEAEESLELSVGAIEDLDLALLLNATVVTASRREERLSLSPGIISVITGEDVEDYRPYTLYERLSMVAGIELIESYFGMNQVTVRGLLQTHYNNQTLFMINGHPLYAPVTGAFNLFQAPELAIDRVEVIRGPASALYATNAFGGVINLITRRPGDRPEARVYALLGSYFRRQVGFSATGRAGEIGAYVFGSFADDDGYPFIAPRDEDGRTSVDVRPPSDPTGYEELDHYAFYGGAEWRDFQLNLGYFSHTEDKFGIIPTVASTGPRTTTGWLGDFTFRRELVPGQTLMATLRYHGYETHELSASPPVAAAMGIPVDMAWQSHTVGGEAWWNGAWLDDTLHTVVGVQLSYQASPYYRFVALADQVDPMSGMVITPNGQPVPNASPWLVQRDYVDFGAYANLDWHPVDWLKLVGGVLVNWNSLYDAMVAPRAAALFPVSDEVVLKVMYGRAYRAPSIFEQWVDTPNVLFGGNLAGRELGIGNLQPQSVDTVETAFEWRPGNYSLRVTGYFLWTDRLIDRGTVVPAGSPLGNTRDTPAYSNNPGQRLLGAELEMEGRPVRELRFFVNASVRTGWDQGGNPLPYWYAPVLANAGATWRPFDVLGLHLIARFVGPRSGTLQRGTMTERSIELDPIFLLDARVSVRPDPMLELSLAARNVFDLSYSYPEYIRQRIDVVPGGPGFQIFGEVALRL